METIAEISNHSAEACLASINAVKDTLYVVNGKWKLPLLVALQNGPKRFNEIQRALDGITPRILSKELRELELLEMVVRKVMPTTPVIVTYELTPYSRSLDKVLFEMQAWGAQHRQRIKESGKKVVVGEIVK